jgi:protein-S-isoprenylcysteine O-methyltransferase Ste14
VLFLRALLSFLLLPGVVAFLGPWLLAPPFDARQLHSIGIVIFVAGVILLFLCVREFYVAGKGTLAPWDPPRHLVMSGPYRFSRNPMYVAVALILVGWAAAYGTRTLWLYALGVSVAFHLRVVLAEEPWQARTFPDEWERYKARVPRWLF